jgi:hypothetical protein
MSIEPFFRDEPHLRDELADTRKEVITIRHDDDLYGVDGVHTPPTYAMGLAERLAAFHADGHTSSVDIAHRVNNTNGADGPFELTTITLEDLDLNEPLEDFDSELHFDRKTLPSAPYPPAILDDGAANLNWDVLPAPVPFFPDSTDLPFDPPDSTSRSADRLRRASATSTQTSADAHSDEHRSGSPSAPSSSSLWGKLQRFVTGISKPRSQPPGPSSSPHRLSQRAIFDLIWTLDNAALDNLSTHIERIIATRRLGPEAYAESRIVDLLDSLMYVERAAPDGVSISVLRARIPEVARPILDHALLRLENRGIVALLPEDPGHDGILDPVRGHLSRCILLQTAG